MVERRYAVFPQRSGALEIEGPCARGAGSLIRISGDRGSVFQGAIPSPDFDRMFGLNGLSGGGFVRPDPTDPVAGEEPPAPGAAAAGRERQAHGCQPSRWPSTMRGPVDPPQFRVGEPVTRSIAITAQGLVPCSCRICNGAALPDKGL